MNETCTLDLLVKFLYHETTAAESRLVRQGIEEDILLREEFLGLQKAARRLPKVRFSAPANAIQAVLQFSKHSTLEGQF